MEVVGRKAQFFLFFCFLNPGRHSLPVVILTKNSARFRDTYDKVMKSKWNSQKALTLKIS
jgi:hypothetical protein